MNIWGRIKIFNDNFGLNQALAKNDMEAFKEIVNTAIENGELPQE